MTEEAFEERISYTSSQRSEVRSNKEVRERITQSWQPSEDLRLAVGIKLYGSSDWVNVARIVGNKNRKQCRQRYYDHFCKRKHTPIQKDQQLSPEEAEVVNKMKRCFTYADRDSYEVIYGNEL